MHGRSGERAGPVRPASIGCTSPASSILDPQTLDDIGVYGGQPPPWTASLAFLGDCDGDAASFVDELVAQAEPGLRRIFAHCRDFGPSTDLRYWMIAHAARPTASYVNWIGRTVRQIREEAALREALIGRARELGGESRRVAAGSAARPAAGVRARRDGGRAR